MLSEGFLLTTINIVRFLIEAVFCYLIYHTKQKDMFSLSKLFSTKEPFIFFFTYVLTYWMWSANIPARFILTIVTFAFFWIKSNKVKEWVYSLTFSVFLNLMIECCLLVSFFINRATWYGLRIESLRSEFFVLYTLITYVLEFCFLFLIYKIRFIKAKDIRNISISKSVTVVFSLCLITVIYLKYNVGAASDVALRNTFVWIFMLSLPTYLIFYKSLNKLAKLKNIEHNEDIDGKIEHLSEIPVFSAIINVASDSGTYEKQRRDFKRKLANLNIDHGSKGFIDLILCLIMIKNFEGENLECENIIKKVSQITKTPQKEIRLNIKNMVKKTWIMEDIFVINRYYNGTVNEYEPPSVDEFLVNMAKVA